MSRLCFPAQAFFLYCGAVALYKLSEMCFDPAHIEAVAQIASTLGH